MAIKHPTIKQLIAELNLEDKVAAAVKYIMRNYSNIPYLFDVCGYMRDDMPTHAKTKLKPFQDLLESNFPGPTNMPKGDIHSALILIDKLIETHGIEHLQFKDEQEYKIDVDYCNAGDTYANTLYYSTADSAFVIGTWGDLVEEYENCGYKPVEKHEVTY